MPMSSLPEDISQLRPAMHQLRDWVYGDEVDHRLFAAYMKTAHDVGGEPDAPVKYVEKEEEIWELNTFITCEVLGWRGIWTSEERRRLGNVDLGKTQYSGLPYYGRWVLAMCRLLVEKHHITLRELTDRADEVHQRIEGDDAVGNLQAEPSGTGDGAGVRRNEHHTDAIGKGDPQCFAGMAGDPRFSVGESVRVRTMPALFYTRTPEYMRGVTGTVVSLTYESLAAEDEAFDREDQPPEWFYIVRFKMDDLWDGYAGPAIDTLQAELEEHWLEPVT